MPSLFQTLWTNSPPQVDYLQTTASACILWYLYWIPRKLSRLASLLSWQHPQCIVITRDAYFDKDFSSALAFDSKPFAGAIPIQYHLDPNGLKPSENSEPSIIHQTGSAANLGHSPSTFIEEHKDPEQPIQEQDSASSLIEHQQVYDIDTDSITNNDTHLGLTPPTPQMINLTQHQKRHTPLQKKMTLYFQECSESPPSVDPIHTVMLIVDATALSSDDKMVDKYLPEPQSFKAVLNLMMTSATPGYMLSKWKSKT